MWTPSALSRGAPAAGGLAQARAQHSHMEEVSFLTSLWLELSCPLVSISSSKPTWFQSQHLVTLNMHRPSFWRAGGRRRKGNALEHLILMVLVGSGAKGRVYAVTFMFKLNNKSCLFVCT